MPARRLLIVWNWTRFFCNVIISLLKIWAKWTVMKRELYGAACSPIWVSKKSHALRHWYFSGNNVTGREKFHFEPNPPYQQPIHDNTELKTYFTQMLPSPSTSFPVHLYKRLWPTKFFSFLTKCLGSLHSNFKYTAHDRCNTDGIDYV